MSRFMVRGDYSQIEARVIAWLAGAAWKLDAFRACDAGTGPDIYRTTAADILHKPVADVTSAERQGTGKVPELSLGFGGGVNALQKMAQIYNVHIPAWKLPAGASYFDCEPPDGTDEWIKRRWRIANPEIVALWAEMESQAVACLSAPPGGEFPIGGTGGRPAMRYKRNGELMTLRLPSGRCISYWNPRLVAGTTPWGKPVLQMRYHAEDAGRWMEWPAYGGLLAQGVTQATARDIMADAMIRLEPAGLLPVLTVHDEAIAEGEYDSAMEASAAMEAVMNVAPAWTDGLPVAVEASAGPRYLKG